MSSPKFYVYYLVGASGCPVRIAAQDKHMCLNSIMFYYNYQI